MQFRVWNPSTYRRSPVRCISFRTLQVCFAPKTRLNDDLHEFVEHLNLHSTCVSNNVVIIFGPSFKGIAIIAALDDVKIFGQQVMNE